MWRQEQILMESEYYIAAQLLMNANGAPCLLEEKKKTNYAAPKWPKVQLVLHQL